MYLSILGFTALGLIGCSSDQIKPINDLNGIFSQPTRSYREPGLGQKWLVALSNSNGKDRIVLINLTTRRNVLLPGINRPDAQPISVSVSANGQKLVFIRQRADKTELLLYRRKIGTVQRLDINPKGVPRRVSLDGSGRFLAVQVSREGRWDVDLIRLPG